VSGTTTRAACIVCRSQQDEPVDVILRCDDGLGVYLIEFQLLSRSRDSAFKGRRNAVGIPTSSITFICSLPDPQALNRELIISLSRDTRKCEVDASLE